MNKPTSLKIILAASALFYLAFIFGTSFVIQGERYFTLVDDAMISMRYAKHLAQGHGLVWNVGEPSAQGFTNLGWTLYMAFLHLFPFSASKISLAVMLTSLMILLANIVVVHKTAEALAPESNYAPTLAALIVAFYFPLVFWSLRGMEVGLLVLLIDVALLLVISKDKTILVGVVLALAIFVRVDALIAAALIVVYLFAKNKRRAVVPAIAVVLATLAVFYFQQTYYGDYLPTTYYQKVAGYAALERAKRGVLVFVEFAARDTLALFLFSLAGIFFYNRRNRETFLLLAVFLAQCAYSIYVGGDYAEPETNSANRFITQGVPALILLFSWIASRFLSDLIVARSPSSLSTLNVAKRPALVLAVMVLLVISGEPWFNYAIDNAPFLKSDIRRVKLALRIAANTSPEAVIAVHAAGQIPYYSERKTIDLLGLNDPVIANGPGNGAFYPGHNKWNYEYSVGQLQPDLVADNFEPLAGYMRANPQYQMLPSDVYVRKDSLLVNIKGISSK